MVGKKPAVKPFLVMYIPALSTAARQFLGGLALFLVIADHSAVAQTTLTPVDSALTPSSAPTAASDAASPAEPAASAAIATSAVPAAPDTVVLSELRRLSEKWADASVRNDAETMSQLMAPEYVSINSKGRIMQRPDMLRAIASGRAKIAVNKGFDYFIRVYGDVGVVMHNSSFMGSLNGVNTSGEYRSTHLYVRREGRWQLASSQTTYVAPIDSRASLSVQR